MTAGEINFLQTVFGMWTLFTHLVEEGSLFINLILGYLRIWVLWLLSFKI